MPTHLFTQRQGQGPLLLMVHGWGTYSGIFAPLVPLLTQKFTVLLVDLPGFGHSPLTSPQDYQFTQLVHALSQLLDEPTYCLGWSLGGLLTLGLALHYPEKVRGLIQVATNPCFLAKPDWAGIPLATFKQFHDNLKKDYMKTLQQFIMLQIFQSENYKMQLQKINTILQAVVPPAPAALDLSFHLLQDIDLRSQLAAVQCPMLNIFGRLDAIVPRQVAEQVAAQVPQTRSVVLSRASHVPFLSHTAECAELINVL